MRRAVLTVALAAAAVPAGAGTVELVLRDENGAAIPLATVLLRTESGTVDYRLRYSGETDAAGRVSFAGVEPGPYRVALQGDVLGRFVDPEQNPRVPPPRITLAEGEERARAEVVLWHGVSVFCRIVFEGRETRSVSIRFHELDLGSRFDRTLLRDQTTLEQLLLPGRWEVALDPPEGFLLRDVEIDGASIAGSVARLELELGAPPSHVAWYFTEPAHLSGRVTFESEEIPVRVEAELLEPGSWIEAALARGGSDYQSVSAGVDGRGFYSMVLPDGRWSVRATGPEVDASEPPSVELTLGPGEDRRQDFHVHGAGSGALLVEVRSPDDKQVEGAVVEVWPLASEPVLEEPGARALSNSFSTRLPGVPAGDWRVAAAREGFLEGSAEIHGFAPGEDPSRRRVRVELQRGAALHAVALDTHRRMMSGIELALERLDEPPPQIVRAPELAARLLAPRAATDATGHAWLRGLWPGRWALTGTSGVHAEEPWLVRFRDGERLVERLELDLGDGTTSEVEAVLVAAARITGRLVCGDGSPLGGLVSVVAVPDGVEASDSDPETLVEGARLRVDRVPLTGSLHDAFTAGPLGAGFWLVALRPEGHDRWTWAPGVEHPSLAARVQAGVGEPVDLGTIPADCGPAIRLTPRVVSGQALPDLRRTPTAAEPRVTIAGGVEVDGELRAVREPVIDLYRDHVRVRSLPEGAARLEVVITDETFLPMPELRAATSAALERGRLLDLSADVAAIGGALVVGRPAATWVRLTAADGRPVGTLGGGRPALFTSLAPGDYRVRWCADTGCAAVTSERGAVAIEAGRTVRVDVP